MDGWGSRVLNFLVKIKCHVYVAYLTILSILFFHQNLEIRSIFRKVVNCRGDWVCCLGLFPKKNFFGCLFLINLRFIYCLLFVVFIMCYFKYIETTCLNKLCLQSRKAVSLTWSLPALSYQSEEQYHAGQIPSVWHLIYVCDMYTQKRKKEK